MSFHNTNFNIHSKIARHLSNPFLPRLFMLFNFTNNILIFACDISSDCNTSDTFIYLMTIISDNFFTFVCYRFTRLFSFLHLKYLWTHLYDNRLYVFLIFCIFRLLVFCFFIGYTNDFQHQLLSFLYLVSNSSPDITSFCLSQQSLDVFSSFDRYGFAS